MLKRNETEVLNFTTEKLFDARMLALMTLFLIVSKTISAFEYIQQQMNSIDLHATES